MSFINIASLLPASITFLLLMGQNSRAQGILINEISTCDQSIILDDRGQPQDWIELFNSSEYPISLTGHYLSDDPEHLLKWEIPELVVQPHDFLLILATGERRASSQFPCADFKLKCHGEPLFLTGSNGQVLDIIEPVSLSDGTSYGRCPDGSIHLGKLFHPSPGQTNNTNDLIVFSKQGGFYENDFELTISTTNSNDTIRYTLDGSVPDLNSSVYTQPIIVTNRTTQPNSISNVDASIYSNTPPPNVYKGTVIRAATFQNSTVSSEVSTHTFFISSDATTRYAGLDVISISIDSLSLFDADSGIYLPGSSFVPDTPNWTGNYFNQGDDWERKANLEYFSSTGNPILSQQVGVRIHGGASRRNRQKSLRLYARNEYGTKYFGYPLFTDRPAERYKRFILRSGFSDPDRTHIKDLITANLTKDLSFDVMLGKPIILFINGEYWGIQNIREYMDRHYIDAMHGVDTDNMDLLTGNAELNPLLNGEILEGSNIGWQQVQEYLMTHSFTDDEHYDHIVEFFDIENLIDYYATEIFFNNRDWPKKNYKYWRVSDPPGKFRFKLHDVDAGWGFKDPALDMLEHASTMLSEMSANPPYANRLFNKLLQNQGFQNSFLNRLACLMVNEFRQENLLWAVNSMVSEYEPAIDEHWNRWFQSNVSAWNDSIDGALRDFAATRHDHVIEHVENAFGIDFNPEHRCEYPVTEIIFDPSDHISIYPNPTSHSIGINLPDKLVRADIEILNSFGVSFHKTSTANYLSIDTSGWPAGFYSVIVNTAKKTYSSKLVILGH